MPSQSDIVVKEKRTRASRPKVRTGCITCKIRHKKCDETNPSCLQCTSTGRKCDGYQQPIPRNRSSSRRVDVAAAAAATATAAASSSSTSADPRVVSAAKSLSLRSDSADALQNVNSDTALARLPPFPSRHGVILTDRERRCLDFFRIHTAAQCSGYMQDEFWYRLVLQVSEIEPSIRHAAIALGALQRNFECLAVDDRLQNDAFPLQQCNKAIVLLRKRLGSDGRIEPVLVACILLISFSFLQGDTSTALSHYYAGVRLLREWQQKGSFDRSTQSTLTKLFARLELYLSIFASLDDDDPFVVVATEDDDPDRVRADLESIAIPDKIESLDQASALLFGLIGLAMQNEQRRIFRSSKARRLREMVQAGVSSKFDEWTRKLNMFLQHNALSLSLKDSRIVLVLQLWSETIQIMNAAHNRESEMEFDAFEPQFRRIVRLAEALLEEPGDNDRDSRSRSRISPEGNTTFAPTFSVETGIIPALFYCCYKCRNLSIRREVLSLLHRSQRQEGVWQTRGAAAILERLVDIESEGLAPGETVPVSARILAAQVKITPNDPNIRLRYCLPVKNPADGTGTTQQWKTEWLKVPPRFGQNSCLFILSKGVLRHR